MTVRVLVIEPDGTVRSVYSDRLPLRALGRIHTTRASHVEFDEARQVWVSTATDGTVLSEGPSREAVVAEEIRVLEAGL